LPGSISCHVEYWYIIFKKKLFNFFQQKLSELLILKIKFIFLFCFCFFCFFYAKPYFIRPYLVLALSNCVFFGPLYCLIALRLYRLLFLAAARNGRREVFAVMRDTVEGLLVLGRFFLSGLHSFSIIIDRMFFSSACSRKHREFSSFLTMFLKR